MRRRGALVLLVLALFLLTAVLCIWNLKKKTNNEEWWETNLIAHAGGGIQGKTCTNSREALDSAAANGYHVIEVDFSLTEDGELVLVHGWDEDTMEILELGDICEREQGIPDADTFQQTRICRKFTSMTGRDLVSWIKVHPDIYILIDTKYLNEEELKCQYQQLVELCSQDERLLDRFVVQVYDVETYDCIMGVYEFKNIVYATYLFASDDMEYWKKVASDCEQRNILVVSVPRQYVSTRKYPYLPYVDVLKDSGLLVCTYVVNTLTDMERMQNAGVDIITTDFLLEDDLQYLRAE